MPYVHGRDDRHRDRDQRGAMRDEEHGYQDPRDQRGLDTWRANDRGDQRLDDGEGERFGGRGWSSASDQYAERDRSMFEHRGDRGRQRDDNYGNYGNYGNHGDRPFEMDRMRGYDDQSRGGHGDQGTYGQRGYYGQGGGYSRQDPGGGYSGQRGSYYDRGGYDDQRGGYDDQRGGYYGQSGGYYGQSESYSGRGGQSGAQAGDMSSTMRGQHRGKGPAGFQRSDERIREMVCDALTDHDDIDATHIEVNVKDGEVTLTGTVDDRRRKRLAEECVENVRGVKDVQNQLRISPESKTGSSSTSGLSGTSTSGLGGTGGTGATGTGSGLTGTAGSSGDDEHDQADTKPRPS